MGRFRSITGGVAALLAVTFMFSAEARAMSIEAPNGTEDSATEIVVAGAAATSVSLFVYVSDVSGALGCEVTASGQELASGAPLISDPVGPGSFEVSAGYKPNRPGKLRVCAYLTTSKSSVPIESERVSIAIVSGKAYTPHLGSPANGKLAYERAPALSWPRGAGRDTLRIYRGGSPESGYVIAALDVSGFRSGFSLKRTAKKWKAQLKRKVAYGTYAWTVTRRDPRVGTTRTTAHRRFRVGPSPLRRLVVKLRTKSYSSIKRPGVSHVVIRSSPEARIRYRLSRGGRTISTRRFRESRFNPSTRLRFPWSCSRTGNHKLTVAARDRYGNKRSETVRWNVSASRCAEMKRAAEERRKAKEEAAEDGGGGSCTPGYSPCLPPASDYDCAGGSGDGPKYVSGPVYITGSDPYGLDSDGDGIGCE